MSTVVLASRWILGLLLLRAGVGKLVTARAEREATLHRYAIMPDALTPVAAAGLPIAELMLAVLLFTGTGSRVTGTICAVLFACFGAAVAINLVRGREFACGCGGQTPRLITWRLVAEDAGWSLASVAIAVAPTDRMALWPGPGTGPAHPGMGTDMPVVLSALLAGLLKTVVQRGRQLELLKLSFAARSGTRR